MFRKLLLTAVVFVSCGIAAPSNASPVATNQWYNFAFGAPGTSFLAGRAVGVGTNPTSIVAPTPPWTFTLAVPGTLVVVDGFIAGDQFDVTDFGTSIGLTSAPDPQAATCGNNITACLADPGHSKGFFSLAAGSHSISGIAVLSPLRSGGAFFDIQVAALPEPATLAILSMGLFGLAGLRRRS